MAGDNEIWCEKPWWRGFRFSAEIAIAVVTVVGMFVLLAELLTMNDLARKETSFRFVERYNSGEIAEARLALRTLTADVNRDIVLAGGNGLSDEQRAVVVDALFLSSTDSALANLDALLTVVRFFDEAGICVKTGLCHADTICQFLRRPAETLANNFSAAWIKQAEAQDLLNLGAGLQSLRELQCQNLFSSS